MTIDEAIDILERDRFDNPDYYLQDFQKAIDLGIEALECIKTARASHARLVDALLEGETEE